MAESTSKDTKSDPSPAEIQSQIDRLREDISSLTRSVSEFGHAQANSYTSRAQRKGREFAENSQHMFDQARHEFESVEHEIEGRVRENPLGAVALAAGAGFLLALISRR